MGDAPDFIQKFHNLEGDLISVRKKNLYKLLKTPSLFQNEEQLSNALKNIKPKTYQEHIFYIDTLVYFKRADDLLELLKSGNELYASKILKQLWFFETAFKDVNIEKLVNDFLPFLSYAIRKKLITRILKCWEAERIDLLFDAINKKYGLAAAISVLHKCTPNKIKSVLIENEIKLRPNQVLQLLHTSDDVFVIYLDHINKMGCGSYQETKVLNHLARRNPNLYLDLQRVKKIISPRLSKRLTKKFVPLIKDDFLTNSKYYFNFLNNAVAIRKLGYDFEIIYENLFPKEFNDINSYCLGNRLLEYYPKSRKWNLFLKTFTQKFSDRKLDQVLLRFNVSLKKLNPPKEIFLKWAELRYNEQETNYEKFLKHFEPAVCIPIIKEKINVTKEIYARGNLIEIMINSCSEHKDFHAFEKVLQYICFRHRNEDADFRNRVLNQICINFKLEDLNENHWKHINEQIKILKIKKEFSFFTNAQYLERYLEFLFKNKKDYKEELFEYINEIVGSFRSRILNLNNKPIEKEILTEIGKQFLEIVDKDSDKFYNFQKHVLDIILNFSISNPEYCINLKEFPHFLQLIRQSFQMNKQGLSAQSLIPRVLTYNLKFPNYAIKFEDSEILNIILFITKENNSFSWFSREFSKFVQKQNRSNLENSILLLYFDKIYENHPDIEIVNWYLNKEPLIVVPYFDKIIKSTIHTYTNLDFKSVRHYSHLNFVEKICNFYKIKLDDEKIDDKKRFLIGLSILLTTDELLKLVEEKYLPTKIKLDMQDAEMLKMYKLQCEVVQILGTGFEIYKMLPTIMKFCRGDYLQSALKPLYKAFYKSPERILYSYVETLSKMAVSARKHAIFLSCEVLDKEHTLNLLKNKTEENISSQKYLFSATLKYFLKNPSQDLLEKLIESMNSIDKNDAETLDSLKNITVPLKYRTQYLESCWKFFESMALNGVIVTVYLEQLLNKMEGEILRSLSAVFVTDIITNYFLNKNLAGSHHFVIEVLRNRVSERTQHFTLIFDKLSKSDFAASDFFNRFILVFRDKVVDQNLINIFAQYWKKYFTILDFLNEHINLDLRLLQLSSLSTDNFANSVINYLEKLLSEFGFHVYYNFKTQLNAVVSEMNADECYSLLLAILQYKLDSTSCILVLEIFRHNSSQIDSNYYKIINILKNVKIPIVCAYYKNLLSNKV